MFHHMECEKKYCFCSYKKEDFSSPLSLITIQKCR